MVSYEIKKEEINALLEEGNEILEVEFGDKNIFFVVETFEPPVGGSVSSAKFLSFTGKDITAFLEGDVFSLNNVTAYTTRFNQLFSQGRGRRFQFSDDHTWRLYQQ